MLRAFQPLLLAAPLLAQTSESPPGRAAELAGDWAGWAYLDDGGDFPLRIRARVEEGLLGLTLDFPHLSAAGVVVGEVKIGHDDVSFERATSDGGRWRYRLERRGDVLAGRAEHDDGSAFELECERSAVPLPSPPPHLEPAEHEGIYRAGDGRSIVVTSWRWGELRFIDPRSGRVGTLFATSESEVFAGPAEYVPAPVWATGRFERDGEGRVAALQWAAAGLDPVHYSRHVVPEVEVSFESGDSMLAGTLLEPPGPGPHTAIVVVGGSDWGSRSQVRREAGIFASFGLAVLIFDARGYGDSTGERVCSFSETAADIAAAVGFLRGRPAVDPGRVGIFGRSRGGWFAPLAAAGNAEVGFLVLFVPPAVSPEEQEATRRLGLMRQAGHDARSMAEAEAYLELLWRCLDSEEAWERYVVAHDAIEAKGWGPMLQGLPSRDSEGARWMRLNMAYDPLPALERVTAPTLALFGARDDNVTPLQNAGPFAAALARAGNPAFAVRVVPAADHGLGPVEPDGAAPALHRSRGYAPEVWPTVRAWLLDRRILSEGP